MPVKVLIADDAAFMRNVIRDVFQQDQVKSEFEIVGEAGNGIEAIDLFKELKPDLITMDIVMPIKSGIEATREILEISKDVKVIMCSALGQEPLVMEAIEAGASDFIVKPFKPDDFLAVVAKVLGK